MGSLGLVVGSLYRGASLGLVGCMVIGMVGFNGCRVFLGGWFFPKTTMNCNIFILISIQTIFMNQEKNYYKINIQ